MRRDYKQIYIMTVYSPLGMGGLHAFYVPGSRGSAASGQELECEPCSEQAVDKPVIIQEK